MTDMTDWLTRQIESVKRDAESLPDWLKPKTLATIATIQADPTATHGRRRKKPDTTG